MFRLVIFLIIGIIIGVGILSLISPDILDKPIDHIKKIGSKLSGKDS